MRVSIVDRRALDPEPFKTQADFFRAVRDFERGAKDPALMKLVASSSDSPADVAFALPTSYAPAVLATGPDDDPSMGRTKPIEMDSPTVYALARVDKNHATSTSGGLQLYRLPEDTSDVTVNLSRTEYESIPLNSHMLVGASFATERVLTDSFRAYEALLEEAVRDEFAGRFLEERVWGSGVGEFGGVLRSPALITIAKESGQSAATIVWQNIINMRARCWRYRQAVWLASQEAVAQLSTLTIPIGDGGAHVPAWQAGNSEAEIPDQLLGRPLYYSSDVCAPLGDFGDLMLVNWSQYLDATWRPIETASSIHVRFSAVERMFRFSFRGDGAPWWRSPLTPRRSTTTLSPYVALAERH